MTADLPPVGATVTLPGLGSITRMGDLNFRAETLDGKRYISHNCMRPDMGYRTAENYLRKRAGVETLPRLCSVCGVEIPPTCTYCSRICADSRKGRTSAENGEMVDVVVGALERAQKAASGRAEGHSASAQPATSKGNYSLTDVRDLRAARIAADNLIRQRGGRVPERYEGYLRDLR